MNFYLKQFISTKVITITWMVFLVVIALTVMPTISVGQTTINVQVSSGSDDGFQQSGGDTKIYDSSIELGKHPYAAVRFQNVNVPKGATITNAYVRFRASSEQDNTISIQIYGQDADNTSAFSETTNNISSRTHTSANVSWSSGDWEDDDTINTSNISSVIQEIVDRDGWNSGNSMVILLKSNNTSRQQFAYAYDGSSSNAPRLYVTYSRPPQSFYVRTDGNNSNSGEGPSASEAWATLASAVDETNLVPGDTIYVMPGTYSSSGITPSIDGESGNTIKFIADRDGSIFGTPGEAYLTSTGSNTFLFSNDDYLEFDGFKISGGSSDTIYVSSSDGVVFKNCEIYGSADNNIEIDSTNSLVIINCIIRDAFDHGIFTDSGTVAVWNSNIVDNGEDGVHTHGGTTTIANCIVANNVQDGLQDHGGTISHDYNIVYGNGDDFDGVSQNTNELVSDPQFTDAANHDYTLLSTSPAIDAGTDATGIVDEDYFGSTRPIGAGWDLGIHESTLLGSWDIETGSGTTLTDSSGNGNNGSLQGSTSWEAARCGQSITLDGSSDWVDLAQVDLGSRAYTVSIWFKSTSNAQQTIFAAMDTSSGDHHMFLELNNGLVQFVHRSPVASSGGVTLASSEEFNDGFWHHIAAVKSTTDLSLYVDGELVDTVSDTSSVHSSVDLVLGRSSITDASNYFKGSLDSVEVHGSALSTENIAAFTGVLGRWRFDETSGTTAADSSVMGHTGTLNGGQSFDSDLVDPAIVETGLYFNGTTDYAQVSNTSDLQITDAMTISAWIKGDSWTTGSSIRSILRKGQTVPLDYQLGIADSTISFYLDTSSDTEGFRGDTTLATDTWYHVAVTWDGSSAYLYLNGVQDHASAFSKSAPIGTDTRDLYLGGRNGGDYFHGSIDDVRLYNKALCAEEITELYESGANQGLRIIKWVEIR